MATKNNYKDFSFSFEKHPVTGDLLTVSGVEAIKQSVKNIILTNHFERSDPKIGTNIYSSLFKLDSFITINSLKENIKDLIRRYEPRVDILEVFVSNNESGKYKITISFTTFDISEPVSVEFFIRGIR